MFTDSFREYDYGELINRKKYGRTVPLAYNLTKVEVPVIIWYGKNDDIVNEKVNCLKFVKTYLQ